MAQTKLTNMVDPEVLADMISAELPKKIRFAPLADVDNTLQGQPGSTITVPKFAYIGDATTVAEGGAIDLTLLTTTTDQATIKKIGKGAEVTDEAVLSGYGDPVGEAGKQLTMSIAAGVDNDVLAALATTTVTLASAATAWSVDVVDAAQAVFNDEDQEPMVLVMHPDDALQLRKAAADGFTRASELGDNILVSGVVGEVLGAQIVRSNKLTAKTAYLVKRGALKIYQKRNVEVETDRDIVHKTTILTADQHFVAHLYDESKAIKITLS